MPAYEPLVDAFSNQRDALDERAVRAVRSALTNFTGWYSDAQVRDMAAKLVTQVETTQRLTAQLTNAYLQRVAESVVGQAVAAPGLVNPATLREGTDHVAVYERLGAQYRYAASQGASSSEALASALDRGSAMVQMDNLLAFRGQTRKFVSGSNAITGYRRVIRPEMSRSGSCGLCAVASDQVYGSDDLMPIHEHCNCGVLPIARGKDPGRSLNKDEFKMLYDAGGTGNGLKNVRVEIHQHGELGPVLRLKGQNFRGPADVARDARPETLARAKQAAPEPIAVKADVVDRDAGKTLDELKAALGRQERSLAAVDTPKGRARAEELRAKIAARGADVPAAARPTGPDVAKVREAQAQAQARAEAATKAAQERTAAKAAAQAEAKAKAEAAAKAAQERAAAKVAAQEPPSLVKRYAAGVVARQPLTGGQMALKIEKVTLKDGTHLVVKESSLAQEAATEVAYSRVGQQIGAKVARVERLDEKTVIMEFVEDKRDARAYGLDTWEETDLVEAAYVSASGQRLGLLDTVMQHQDRHTLNWMVDKDGDVVGIDNGLQFVEAEGMPASPFAHQAGLYEGREYGQITSWLDHDYTPADMDRLRAAVQSAEAELRELPVGPIAKYGKNPPADGFEAIMRRVDALAEHARGKVDKIDA